MISRNLIVSAGLIAMATPHAGAQVGPLKDPIPHPIPQSSIGVRLQPIVTGLTSPIFLTVPGETNGRRYIVDQTGLVLVLKGGGLMETPFLDIRGVLSQLKPAFPGAPQGLNPGYDERGLLGLAFHPDFHDRDGLGFGTLYTLHNVPITRVADFKEPPFPDANVVPNCQEVIAEWRVSRHDPDAVDPASYREVLRFDRPEFNHNGGTIAFGPDRLLYAAFGDGGNANDVGDGHNPVTGNGQDLTTILGKVIRIDPLGTAVGLRDGVLSANGEYFIPKDNPFVTRPDAVREIYAYGFRNPYRFSFDDMTRRLVLADVGQNNIEEVDIVHRGGNYGWNKQEGTFLFDPRTGNVFTNPHHDPALINPVVEYDHFEATVNAVTRIAIIGGFVYRGTAVPELQGKYICADLNGFLFVADLGAGRIEQLLDTKMFIKGVGQDSNKELYVLGSTDIGPSGNNGAVFRVLPIRH